MKRISYLALSTTLLTALPLVPLLQGCGGGSSGPRQTQVNGLKLTVNQSGNSNYGNTLSQLKKGLQGSGVTSGEISLGASNNIYNGAGVLTKLSDIRIILKQSVSLTPGTSFDLGTDGAVASLQTSTNEGPDVPPLLEAYQKFWGGVGLASGQLTIEKWEAEFITIRLSNVVLLPKGPETATSARGTLTFNGTMRVPLVLPPE